MSDISVVEYRGRPAVSINLLIFNIFFAIIMLIVIYLNIKSGSLIRTTLPVVLLLYCLSEIIAFLIYRIKSKKIYPYIRITNEHIEYFNSNANVLFYLGLCKPKRILKKGINNIICSTYGKYCNVFVIGNRTVLLDMSFLNNKGYEEVRTVLEDYKGLIS